MLWEHVIRVRFPASRSEKKQLRKHYLARVEMGKQIAPEYSKSLIAVLLSTGTDVS